MDDDNDYSDHDGNDDDDNDNITLSPALVSLMNLDRNLT